MREDNYNFSMRTIVGCIAGTIYEMAPFNMPRKMEAIMNYVVSNTLKKCVNTTDCRYIHTTYDKFSEWLKDMLMGCEEFKELNLSQNEFLSNVSVDDENRPMFHFTSMYDVDTEESMKDDFIDLDACIRNISFAIFDTMEETDCFLCVNAGTEFCNTCVLNSKYKNNHAFINGPHAPEKFKRWCTYSCPKGIAVCCADCSKDTKNCSYVCRENCDTCELMLINPNYEA